MTEPVMLGWIGTISTFLTVTGALVKQGMTLKKTAKGQEKIKKDAAETRQISEKMREENKGGFEDLKALVLEHIEHVDVEIIEIKGVLRQLCDKNDLNIENSKEVSFCE